MNKKVVNLSLLVVLSVLIYLVLVTPRPKEKFTTLYIFNEEGKMQDYPSEVSGSLNLVIGVQNVLYEDEVFRILVKVGDNESAVDPLNSSPIHDFRIFVPHNETVEFPVNLTLNETGFKRVVFELWVEEGENLNYTSRWNQLWLNLK